MSSAPDNSAPNFDRLAEPYRWLEYLSFGPLLQRSREQFLTELEDCRSGLVLGDGDGRFTARLLKANLAIRIHAVDGSEAMLRALRRSAGADATRVRTKAGDIRGWKAKPGAKYDLVVTHFFLDCLTTSEVTELATRVGAAVNIDALWVVSDFAVPRTRFGRWVAAPLVSFLYWAFHLLTGLSLRNLPDHGRALGEAGWVLRTERKRLWGLLISQLWQRIEA